VRGWRSVPVVVVLCVITACTGGHAATPPPSPPGTTTVTAPASRTGSPTPATANRPEHIVVVVFENKTSSSILGSANAPFLNALAARAAVFTDAHAVTHPSQPNYLALFSGSVQGVTDDHCLAPFHDRPNLARQLLDAGRSFAGYAEDQPTVGYAGCSYRGYAAKHVPWAHFDNVPASASRPWNEFPADLAQLPTVAFVVPNLCHDMHDCAVSVGDTWARANLSGYLDWASTHDSLLVVTFDEADGSRTNQILTMVAGANVRAGRYAERVTHYRVLATIEALLGLDRIGEAAGLTPVSDIWQHPVG
jgi:phosphatidylinositol-3-phosphatase